MLEGIRTGLAGTILLNGVFQPGKSAAVTARGSNGVASPQIGEPSTLEQHRVTELGIGGSSNSIHPLDRLVHNAHCHFAPNWDPSQERLAY